MLHLIEPCCAPKHLLALRNKLGENGAALFHGYGDLSLAELLPPMLTRYSEAEMTLVTPTLPDAAAEVVQRMLQRQWVKVNGNGKVYAVDRLILITDLSEKRSPMASRWLADNPYGERLLLRNVQQNDTAILLPDIGFVGNINLTYGGHFVAMATKNASLLADLRNTYMKL